ncbi:MAG: SRPBCC family protein [Actinomycetota bacterium]|nr:SRPBCC family protein [Actinomycetota bacterium]MDH5278190.1 SRPBCC family protein [Actinomycetota bacterium]
MAERVVFTTSVQVARPPEEVFAYLTDVSRHAEWSPKAYRVEGMSAGDHVVEGSQFVSYGWLPNDKDHRNDVEATVVDAPSRLELTSSESGEKFVNTFTVTAAEGGSQVDRTMDMPRPGGALGAVFPVVLATLVKPNVKKGMGMLKSSLESPG